MMHDIFFALEQGATLLTANRRLARHLCCMFDARQEAKGRAAWRSADVLPLPAWLGRCWDDMAESATLGEHPALLNTQQELTLWERIITESPQGQGLLRVSATAQDALEAWALLMQWKVMLDGRNNIFNEDVLAVQRWAQSFEELCRVSGWMENARLPDFIARQIHAGALKAPRHLLLAGFDELTPQQQALFEALRAAGSEVSEVQLPSFPQSRARRVGFADSDAEIAFAARWSRHLLEQGHGGAIGVVIHDLGTLREKVARIFNDVLLPASIMPGEPADVSLYNISLGTPLSDQPLINAALLIIEMAQGKLPLEKLGALLCSPFLAGGEQEMTRRGLLDARLRRFGELTVSVDEIKRHALTADACPLLGARLRQCIEVMHTLPRHQLPSAWAATFPRLLVAMGWPGERPLDSHEYQTVMAWRELLADYARLDEVVARQSLNEALARLRKMAADTLFQPQGMDAPIQILGVMEAAGMHFDHLWVMGLHDEVWPTPPRPNPFLPLSLQRTQGLPHASAPRELAFARRMTERLLASAPEVVMSYPQRDGDRHLRPSPLIVSLEEAVPEGLPGYMSAAQIPSYAAVTYQAAAIESMGDYQAPSLPEGSLASGGTGIFKQQAACPFRAFAEHRLGARPLATTQIGLNPMERGQLLHASLEQAWQKLHSYERLCSASDEAINDIVTQAVTAAIGAMAEKRRLIFTEKFTELEKNRLEKLVTAWLALEKQRAPFTVFEPEQERVVQVGGINVTTRIDRIDQLPDGRQVIVDYKTGVSDTGGWFGDRPDEPQLPLYCAFNEQEVAALTFAQVRSGDMKFKGLAQYDGIAPGIKAIGKIESISSWHGLVEEWRATLHNLGAAFRTGHAPVDPKNPPQTCKFCALTPLCRIHEHDGVGLEGDAQEAGE
ncbi:MAG: PD-(D/E)XK nuclease family protein [Gammaproteobacteria bacterium]|nr:PD-(D/E)XK nuclease family protein [Gammaproteobacteria bacterium]